MTTTLKSKNTLKPMQIMEKFYAAEAPYVQGGGVAAGLSFDDVAATLHPDVTLHESPDLPWGGTYRGHAGWQDFFSKMIDAFTALEIIDIHPFEQDDTVVIYCKMTTHSRANGTVMTHPMVQVMTMKDDRIFEARAFYWNVPDYIAAAGL
ncbi:nuclear transport factor 2 family protein [Pseudomonas oryzihabitans]|uniref:nuclear transport factor 2 family protein n=1 Tax=Pseudomonas oryzihabitans TaxID=47885 RepID=UPI0028951BD3|nr:nuclear transport factor 2 family protein [Pseudomonas oryzihabitans]MDT3723106.1 nuclear transport factor 2 family protein [Pseudomonas oryzihabitans]